MGSQDSTGRETPPIRPKVAVRGVNKALPIAALCCSCSACMSAILTLLLIDADFPNSTLILMSLCILSAVTGMILAIVSLCFGRARIGIKGKVLSIIALCIPIAGAIAALVGFGIVTIVLVTLGM